MKKEMLGEFLGTFVLVFIGCGSVIAAVVLGWLTSLPQVALVWGIGVTTAIYASKKLCPAHLNPAVTISMFLSGNLTINKVLPYWISQLFGGFIAALFLFIIFSGQLLNFETQNAIIRNGVNGYQSAQVFGEFFPNPGFEKELTVSHFGAFLYEAVGTFILLAVIYIVTGIKQLNNLAPALIGSTITCLIIWIAPYTQAGFNPARDYGPRLLAYFSGWGSAAFSKIEWSFLTVYILGPLVGGAVAGGLRSLIK